MRCKVGVAEGNELFLYSFPSPHPFNSGRVMPFYDELRKAQIRTESLRPRLSTRDQLALFHTEEHIRYVELASRAGRGFLDQGDTPAFRGIFEAARYAVGSTTLAVERVARGELDHAFNPSGGLHHARRDSSAGFCVFNDIGVSVEVLRRQRTRRILYVDIDAHHGDGVYYSYESDPRVFIFDIHEDGRYLYPGTGSADENGKGKGAGTKVNVPLVPGSGDGEVFAQLPRLEELAKQAKPQFIIFQCGADGLEGDPLAGLRYSTEAHRRVGDLLHKLSHEFCDGRMVALGGGGYVPANCAAAWTAVVSSMCG